MALPGIGVGSAHGNRGGGVRSKNAPRTAPSPLQCLAMQGHHKSSRGANRILSPYKLVYWNYTRGHWFYDFGQNTLGTNRRRATKGGYEDEEECAQARDDAARQWYPHLHYDYAEEKRTFSDPTSTFRPSTSAATNVAKQKSPTHQTTTTAGAKRRRTTDDAIHEQQQKNKSKSAQVTQSTRAKHPPTLTHSNPHTHPPSFSFRDHRQTARCASYRTQTWRDAMPRRRRGPVKQNQGFGRPRAALRAVAH